MGFNKEFRPSADYFPNADENPTPGGVIGGGNAPLCTSLCICDGRSSTTLTNQSSSKTNPTELDRSLAFDARGYKGIRLVIDDVKTIGAATSRLIVQYALTKADALAGTFADPGLGAVEVSASLAALGPSLSDSFLALDTPAIADVFWHVFSIGGDGIQDPEFTGVHIQFTTGVPDIADCPLFVTQTLGDDFSSYGSTAAMSTYIASAPPKYNTFYGDSSGSPTPTDWELDTSQVFNGHPTLKGIYTPAGLAGAGWDSSFDPANGIFSQSTFPTEVWMHARLKFSFPFYTPWAASPLTVGSLTLLQVPMKNLIDGQDTTISLDLYSKSGGSAHDGIWLSVNDSLNGFTEIQVAVSPTVIIGSAGFKDVFLHVWREAGATLDTIWHARAYLADACGPVSPMGSELVTDETNAGKCFYGRFNNPLFFASQLAASQYLWNAGWQIAADLGSNPWGL